MSFTDRMFLLWYDAACVAAALPAAMVLWSVVSLPLGVINFITTLVGQYEGAGLRHRIGTILAQGYWSAMLVAPVLLIVGAVGRWIFELSGHEPHLAGLEAEYLRISSFCAPAMLVAGVQASFFIGRGETRRVMVVDVSAALINLILDYLWIFGRGGFPEMGLAGAAWASVVAQWSKVLMYSPQMFSFRYRGYRLADFWRLEIPLMKRLWYYGAPNGTQWLLENAAFTVFLLLVGQLGEEAAAATSLTINVNLLAFIPLLGVAMGVTTLVAQNLGANLPHRARRAALTGFQLAASYTAALAALYVLVPDAFLFPYRLGAEVEQFERLRDLVVALLRFVAAYCVFDAMSVIFAAVLRGAGDTPFLLRVAVYTAAFPGVVTWLGISLLGFGLMWAWGALTVWAWMLGLIFWWRYLQGGWQNCRVIEPEIPEIAPLARPEELATQAR